MENIKPDALAFGPGSSVMTDRAGIRRGLYNTLQDTQGETGAWRDRSELLFETSATAIDTANKQVVLDSGRTVGYDLLVLADGVHSPNAELLHNPSLAARKYAHYDAFKIVNLPPLPEPHNEPLRMHSFNTRHRTQAELTDVFKRKVFFSLFPRKDGTYAAILRFPLTDGRNPRGLRTAQELKALILSMSPTNSTLADVYSAYLSSALTDEMMQGCIDMEPRAFWSVNAACCPFRALLLLLLLALVRLRALLLLLLFLLLFLNSLYSGACDPRRGDGRGGMERSRLVGRVLTLCRGAGRQNGNQS